MFADIVNMSYFNQYLSLSAFKKAGQLSAISDTIMTLIKPTYFLLFVDLIVYHFIFKNVKPRKLFLKAFLANLLVITLLIINPVHATTVERISNQEFFTYHIKNAYNILVQQNINDARIAKDLEDVKLVTSDENSKLHGVAKDRNLIIIQIESFQNMLINKEYNGQELTPNLNKLIKEDSIYFENYYQQLGSGNTSDAEFISNNAIHPNIYAHAYEEYKDNYYYGLPWILKDEGYGTYAFHAYKKDFWNRAAAYPGQGFDVFLSQEDYDNKEDELIGFGLSDREFYKQSLAYLERQKEPFYGFLVSLTSHHPYIMPEEEQKIKLKKSDEGNMFGDYLQSTHYADATIGEFIADLKEKGLYENSMIVIYGDHFGLSANDDDFHENVSNFLGYDYDYEDMMNIPLLINIPGEDVNEQPKNNGGQVDLMPTILNLMGIKNINPYIYGHDLLNTDNNFVLQQTYMLKGSFIKDDVFFSMSRDGVFENSRAWNRVSKKPVDLESCRRGHAKALKDIEQSNYILKKDLLREKLKGKTNRPDDIK